MDGGLKAGPDPGVWCLFALLQRRWAVVRYNAVRTAGRGRECQTRYAGRHLMIIEAGFEYGPLRGPWRCAGAP